MTYRKITVIATSILCVILVVYYTQWIWRIPFLYREYNTPYIFPMIPDKIILNPLRRKTPEIVCEFFFNELSNGSCEKILQPLSVNKYEEIENLEPNLQKNYSDFICNNVNQFNLISWNLVDRMDLKQYSILAYKIVNRSNKTLLIWFSVVPVGNTYKMNKLYVKGS